MHRGQGETDKLQNRFDLLRGLGVDDSDDDENTAGVGSGGEGGGEDDVCCLDHHQTFMVVIRHKKIQDVLHKQMKKDFKIQYWEIGKEKFQIYQEELLNLEKII